MPITAVCPECQSSFRLQDALLGKPMRCPTCQEIFIVQAGVAAGAAAVVEEPKPLVDTPPRTRLDPPPAVSRSGNVSDFVPVIESASAKPVPRPTASRPPVKAPIAAEFPWEEGPRPKGPVAKPAPVEVVWSPEVETPAPPLTFEEPEPEPELASSPVVVGKKRKRGFAVLLVLVLFVLGGFGAGGFFLVRYINLAPERLHAAAHENYTGGKYDQAHKLFDQLAREHPTHALAPEARFFAELSGLRHSVGSVMNKEDPQASLTHWSKFREAMADPAVGPFAAKDRFGLDIAIAGERLAEDVVAKGNASFSDDDPAEAEKWWKQAADLEASLADYRPDDAGRPEALPKSIVALRGRIDAARGRLALLAEAERLLDVGKDENVEDALRYAKANGLDKDPKFAELLKAKEQEIQAKATYTREAKPIPPSPVPDDGLTSLLFAPRADRGDRRPLTGPGTVFYCLARGVLYALDESDGHVLWAARTGLDTDIMPVRVPASDQHAELVMLASNTGASFGITARSAREGTPLWHQPLAVPCQGPPVVVGPNAYVSLGDREGTILEITVATGEIIGRLAIGRPLGPTLAARPGTGLLYATAEARAVYVFEVDRRDPEGKRLDPHFLGAMNTGHGAGSLRGVPVFSNPDPAEPGPKYFVLGQASGLDAMKLLAFKLPETSDNKPDGSATAAELTLPGWASFPPHCDGEKLAVVTDRGEFGLYGLALAGNRDPALFAFPPRATPDGSPRVSRGQVVTADEGTFWILSGGELRKLRFGVNSAEGVRLVQTGPAIPVGEPLHAPQANANGDTFVVVTQDGMSCRAVAVDSRNGAVRWRRDLGLMAKGDPLRVGDAVLMLDQAGGMYRIESKPLADRGNAAWLVDERWMLAPPARGYTAHTGLIPFGADAAFALLLGDDENTGKMLVRKMSPTGVEDRELTLLAPPAGMPVVSGGMMILPLANGTLYRLPLTDIKGTFEEGPSWRAERLPASATCWVAPIDPDNLFATDGGRSIVRWEWPASSKLFRTAGRLTPTERIAAVPVVMPGALPRLVIADAKGNLSMWDAQKLQPPALRYWKPDEKNGLPAGPVTDGLRLATEGVEPHIVYSVGGRMVRLKADADKPLWVGPPPLKAVEGRPSAQGNRVIVTDRGSVVRAIDSSTGQPTGDEFRLSGSHAFAGAAVPIGDKLLLAPLADGTVVLGEWKRTVLPKTTEKTPTPD